MFKTANITLDGTIKGYGNTSFVKVTGNTTIRNGGTVKNNIQFCDDNGIETGASSFSGGAAQGCTLYIPQTTCNPEGNGASTVVDSDSDGVADTQDEYPNDATKAFNNYYPSSTGSATVAFEDNWPLKGDYDLNDLVVSYKYQIVTNASNKVVQVTGDFGLHATGGNFGNGFGVEFPVSRSAVSGVTGGTLEQGQDKAVIVLFTNSRVEMSEWNTRPSDTKQAGKTYSITFNITSQPALADFGLGAYNPFVWNDGQGEPRGSEIHLPGKTPTTLAKTSILGTLDDRSVPASGKYYVNAAGLPWALTIPTSPFSYPKEGVEITSAYLKFSDWALSGGTQATDWYSNTASTYRNTSFLY
jgi:LruC domain-containing protein